MKYNVLGKTGLKVSAVTPSYFTVGSSSPEANAFTVDEPGGCAIAVKFRVSRNTNVSDANHALADFNSVAFIMLNIDY